MNMKSDLCTLSQPDFVYDGSLFFFFFLFQFIIFLILIIHIIINK